MHELHMMLGAIADTWPLMLIPAALWAWIWISDRYEATAKRRENLRVETEAHAARQENLVSRERLVKTIEENDRAAAKMFGHTR